MKKYFFVIMAIIAVLLNACGQAAPAQKQVPTATALAAPTPTAPAVVEAFGPPPAPKLEIEVVNELVKLSPENFSAEMSKILPGISIYQPEIGRYLSRCEVGVATEQNYDLVLEGDGNTCLILLVPQSLTNKKALRELKLPSDLNEGFTLAITKDLFQNGYPILFLTEYPLDTFAWIRVIAHEGFHALQITKGLDCSVAGEECTSLTEEVNAFQIEFQILEQQFGPEPNPEDYFLRGDDWYLRYLNTEYHYYELFKQGLLLEHIQKTGYGE